MSLQKVIRCCPTTLVLMAHHMAVCVSFLLPFQKVPWNRPRMPPSSSRASAVRLGCRGLNAPLSLTVTLFRSWSRFWEVYLTMAFKAHTSACMPHSNISLHAVHAAPPASWGVFVSMHFPFS